MPTFLRPAMESISSIIWAIFVRLQTLPLALSCHKWSLRYAVPILASIVEHGNGTAYVTKVLIKAQKDLIFHRLLPFDKFLILLENNSLSNEVDYAGSNKPLVAFVRHIHTKRHGNLTKTQILQYARRLDLAKSAGNWGMLECWLAAWGEGRERILSHRLR